MADLEHERREIVDAVAGLYARGAIDDAGMERAIAVATAAKADGELRALALSLPGLLESEEALALSFVERPAQSVAGNSSTLKREGAWLSSRLVEVTGRSSSFKLDLRHYAGRRGLSLCLNLAVASSSVTIHLPANFALRNEIADSSASVVRAKGREPASPTCVLVLRGAIKSSSITVKRV